MAEAALDQAAGLRRLMGRRSPRVVPFVSALPRTGQTGVVVNVALALAADGAPVAILDEHGGAGNARDQLGLHAPRDLADVVSGRCTLGDALVRSQQGVAVLAAGRAAAALESLGRAERARLARALAELLEPDTLVLVDASRGGERGLMEAAALHGDAVLLACPGAAALQASYSMMKRLAREYSVLRFRVLAARVASQAEAELVAGRLAETARSHLGALVTPVGAVPHDERFARARARNSQIVEAFPEAVAAVRLRALACALAGWAPGQDAGVARDAVLAKLHRSQPRRQSAACFA